MVELKLNHTIHTLWSDCGGKFTSTEFNNYCEITGMWRQFTNSATPQQNGVVEHANRKLLETARCMVLQAATPRFLWTKAVNTAAFLINRLSAIVNPSQVTHFQHLFRKKLNFFFLRSMDLDFTNRYAIRIKTNLNLKPNRDCFLATKTRQRDTGYGFRAIIYSLYSGNVCFDESSLLQNLENPSTNPPVTLEIADGHESGPYPSALNMNTKSNLCWPLTQVIPTLGF